jgi:chromosomal replication initiation ATPase DnaA
MNTKAQQLVLDLPHRAAMGREDFLVTASNQAAVTLIDEYPNWPSYGAIITGPAGSGKSHLLHVWCNKTGASIFAAEALGFEDVPKLLEKKSLALEWSSTTDERALFHLLNYAKQNNCHLLCASESPPQKWQLTIPDLRSRLNALPVISILPPDDILLRGVLLKLFSDRQINVDEATLSYMIQRMPRSLQSANEIVTEIDQQALSAKAEITRTFVARVLNGFSNPDMFEADT